MSLKLTSGAFQNESEIPVQYSKDGGNISPPLSWSGVPEGTKNLALIMDDPDAPAGPFDHWLVYGIPPEVTDLSEDLPASASLHKGIRQGRNGYGDVGYGGPKPPSGTHRYFFRLYALDTNIDLPGSASREELDDAIQGHVLEEAELMGLYQHRKPGTRAA